MTLLQALINSKLAQKKETTADNSKRAVASQKRSSCDKLQQLYAWNTNVVEKCATACFVRIRPLSEIFSLSRIPPVACIVSAVKA